MTDEIQDDAIASKLLMEMQELLILIQDVYDPIVCLQTYANLTGKLISEEYEQPYALLEFNSYEDGVEKMRKFYESRK